MISIYNKIKDNKIIVALFLLSGLNLLFFSTLFGFHANNDTGGFIWLIDFFRNPQIGMEYPNRYLNPFYGVVGAKLLFFLPSVTSLIFINIIFYFGLVFLTYGLLRRVFKSVFIGFVSALIMMSGYAMLRYGLTQVQDIGGYFWFLLTLYVGWRWWEDRRMSWLFLGGVAVSFGALTKESGCMGALFVGVLFLLDKVSWSKRLSNFCKFSFLPFATIVINAFRGRDVDYNSMQWFIYAWRDFAAENYTFLKWFGVHATTYNILWPFIVIGIYYLYKNWPYLDRNIKIYLLSAIPSSFSYYMWSLFIARTVYISAWFFIPIATFGLYSMYKKGGYFKYLVVFSIILIVVTPYILQHTIRYAHLFKILNDCHRDIGCSWNYFWTNRDLFPTLK